jgi:hypothetical protein
VKVGLIHLCKGLFSLNARIYYSIVHRQAVCNLPGGYSMILPHKGVHCSNWFLSDDARWACLEESMARSLTVISLLLQSTTHWSYRVYTKFLLTYTAIYRRNRKVLPLGITALQSPTFTWACLIHIQRCYTSNGQYVCYHFAYILVYAVIMYYNNEHDLKTLTSEGMAKVRNSHHKHPYRSPTDVPDGVFCLQIFPWAAT